MTKLIDSLLQWLFSDNRHRQSSKKDIADVIDRYLQREFGKAEGHIIRIRMNGYNYYITRSVEEYNARR